MTTALLVASTNAPLRVLGSDGQEHLEYDLILTNVFTIPVTLTEIDLRGPEGTPLLHEVRLSQLDAAPRAHPSKI